jgi:hypothetical protein
MKFYWEDLCLVLMYAWLAVMLAFVLTGCAAPGTYVPPVTISGGFFGATVSVGLGGYTVPAKVVSAPVATPTLMVPASAPQTGGIVPVTTATGQTTSVPVVVAPVDAPVLAVPSK